MRKYLRTLTKLVSTGTGTKMCTAIQYTNTDMDIHPCSKILCINCIFSLANNVENLFNDTHTNLPSNRIKR